eukprot:scaffold1205_cov70-Phaeocystis_antarctica.AAC.2
MLPLTCCYVLRTGCGGHVIAPLHITYMRSKQHPVDLARRRAARGTGGALPPALGPGTWRGRRRARAPGPDHRRAQSTIAQYNTNSWSIGPKHETRLTHHRQHEQP